MEDLVVRNARVVGQVTPGRLSIVEGGLAVSNGRITRIAADGALPAGRQEIDADGQVLMPGFIDPHVHFGLGYGSGEERAIDDFTRDTAAAAVGGVTTFLTTIGGFPGLRNCLQRFKEIGAAKSLIDFKLTVAMVRPIHLPQQVDLFDNEGVNSFKYANLSYRGEEAKAVGLAESADYDFLFKGWEILAKECGPQAVPMIHCEEASIFYVLRERLREQGRTDLRAWDDCRPGELETIHVMAAGYVAKLAGSSVYCVHISSGGSVDAIQFLQGQGIRIIGETCASYLAPVTRDSPIGVLGKVNPPLRGREDCERLWQGLIEGTMSNVGTDHSARRLVDKAGQSILDARPGFPGICEFPSIMTTETISTRQLGWEFLAKIGAENTARIFGIYPKKGVIAEGSDADFVLIDPEARWTMSATLFPQRSDFSIFEGWPIRGRVTSTFVRGRKVAENGQVVAEPPHGQFVGYL